MVGVQALLWYHDLQAEVELLKLLQIVFHTRLDHRNDYDLQVLGLTVRVLEDLPLLLNPLAILTLRWIMCELCHQHTIITITLVQIFLN